MNNIKKSLISILVCSIILSLWGQPVFAEEYYNITGYFDRLLLGIVHGTSSIPLVGDAVQGIAGGLVGDICSGSDDGLHHATEFVDGTLHQKDGLNYALGICLYCGKRFEIYGADVKTAYDNYVETLPAPGYTSDGSLQCSLVHDYFWFRYYAGSSDTRYGCEHSKDPFVSSTKYSLSLNCASNSFSVLPVSGSSTFYGVSATIYYKGTAPIDGYYSRIVTQGSSGYFLDKDGVKKSLDSNWSALSSPVYLSAGSPFSAFLYVPSFSSNSSARFAFVQGIPPIYKITPVASLSGDTYSTTTRPTSITGSNYGIVGDNGQITKVEDNSTIINETNNTYYNPATGTTVPIVNWSYDYSDRSYKVTLESGDTATITYGDENITISQITTTEGDTITNNYTIYYLVDGSGSTTPPCDHAWTETNTTPATCTVPGSKLSTCSKCQQTKKDPLPALGHDWQVKQTVITEYDDTGQLVQQGYTIFECSTCHEQYKSPDGTIPPGGGSGTDPGGEEEDEGFLSWLLGKLGELLGTIGDGILNLLQTALDKIFGGLIDLVNSLFENLAKLVDLFGTVGEAFQVLWTWLPPEIIAILVAGVSIFVFVALLKFFMK